MTAESMGPLTQSVFMTATPGMSTSPRQFTKHSTVCMICGNIDFPYTLSRYENMRLRLVALGLRDCGVLGRAISNNWP